MKLTDCFKVSNLSATAENLMFAGIGISAFFMSISISGVELGTAIAILGWIIKCIAEKKLIVGDMKRALPLLLFFASLIFSFLFSLNLVFGPKDLFKLLWHGLIFFVVIGSVKIKDKMRLLFGLIVFSVSTGALYGVLQYFFGINLVGSTALDAFGKRTFSFFGHPNNFAVVLIMGFPMILYFLVCCGGAVNKILMLALSLLACLCLIFTFSRGAWLGFMASGILWISLYKRKFILLVITIILAIFIFLPQSLKKPIKKRVYNIFNPKDYSTYTRLIYWKAAIKMGLHHPVTGVGLGNFKVTYDKNDNYKDPRLPQVAHRDCHNSYFQILGEAGIASLIFFMWFIIAVFRKIFLYMKINTGANYLLELTVLFSITAFLINGIFDCTLWQVQASVFFWFCCGVAACPDVLYRGHKESN
jgi:putative inorganic carbon (HCO3(-)) transporter